jgi:predicted solute-binding protein
MNYPISMIPYANMAPYETLGPPAGCYFVPCTPRDSIAALKARNVWAAAVPVGGLAALGDEVEPVGLFGIAACREVMSVLFFSDRPFEEVKAPLTVRLTEESASSVRLLYLLSGYANGFECIPNIGAPGEEVNGELLIGDAALSWHHEWERRGSVKGYRYMTDLAGRWYRHCQLPFVFARWVVRTDAPEPVRRSMADWLERFGEQEAALIERSVSRVASRLHLPEAYVQRYLKVIRRRLDASDRQGQRRFLEEWHDKGMTHKVSWFPNDERNIKTG